MKVVLFCGGQGMRLRPLSPAPLGLGDHDTSDLPKPMVPIGGQRPLMWHVMKYYAHFGHKDFILCLGYRGEVIKNYFLHYDEYRTNDFVMAQGGKSLDLLHNDIEDWRITFLDTGLHSNVGQRLKAVQAHLEGEEFFLANYSDGLSDLPLPESLERQAVWASARLRRTEGFQFHLGRFEIGLMECLGVFATLFFASRFVIQWIASERARRSVVPELFWWVSLCGAGLMIVYAVYFGRFAVLLGQLTGWAVYIRNLWLIRREKRGENRSTAPLASA